jgi:hypothetical protein
MSIPLFSINPDDYPDVVATMGGKSLTPVLIVIAGSYATNSNLENSDLDIWGVYLEDEPNEISIDIKIRKTVLGNFGDSQMVFNSLAFVRNQLENPVNDPAQKVWWREDFLAYPRIFDSTHAEDFRKELLKVPVKTVAERYLEAGDWHVPFDVEKMNRRAIRLFLTGARLLEIGDLIVDYKVLVEWARTPSIAEARQRLQTEIDKL